jgi:transcriptional regulator with XRE-family HTH domain
MARKREPTSDAVEIMHRRYFEGKPEMLAMLRQARLNADVAQKVYDLRTKAGLTQRQLAERVGTTASVICRLEDAAYEGHSLNLLQRIAAAVGRQVEVRFVPAVDGAGDMTEAAAEGKPVVLRRAKPASSSRKRATSTKKPGLP